MNDSNDTPRLGRRAALKRMLGISVAAAAAPALLLETRARAAGQCHGATPKSAMQYQDHPHGKEMCSTCTHFCPGATAKAMGTCKVVKGAISPQGWCVAWAKKGG